MKKGKTASSPRTVHRVTKGGKPGYQAGTDGDVFLYKPKDKRSREKAREKAFKQASRKKAKERSKRGKKTGSVQGSSKKTKKG
jgi:hypothetical protein